MANWFKTRKCESCLSLARALELEQKRVSDLTDKVIALSNPAALAAIRDDSSSNRQQGEEFVPMTTVYDAKTGEAIIAPLEDVIKAKLENVDKLLYGTT